MAEPTITFEVEDGTGKDDANSLASYAYIVQYWFDTGRATFDLDESAEDADEVLKIKRATIRASRWLSDAWDWSGYRKDGQQRSSAYYFQSLAWPRYSAIGWDGRDVDPDIVPPEILRATAEAAWYEYQNPHGLTPVFRADQFVRSERAGSVSVEYETQGLNAENIRPLLHVVYDMISHLLSDSALGNSLASGSPGR